MLHVTIFFLLFVPGYYIGISFWKDCAGHRHNGCNFYMIKYNGHCSTLCVWNFPRRKNRRTNSFRPVPCTFYFTISCDDWDDKSATANTFVISCGGKSYIYSLPFVTVSVLSTSNVVGCWISPSARFLSHDPLSSDDILDWENDSMLGIGGVETNVDEGSFVLHNSW